MRASVRWLGELLGRDLDPRETAARLDGLGIEVEAVDPPPARFGDRVVVAEVRGRRPHPDRDKLQLVLVNDGRDDAEVVCGAPNVPDEGARVLLAREGAVLPGGLEIAARKIGGVTSKGMLASETELGLGDDGSGIVVLGPDDPGVPGDPLAAVVPGVDDDVVLELGITPNRPDALGHRGLARDLAVALGIPFDPDRDPADDATSGPDVETVDAREAVTAAGDPQLPDVRVVLEDPERCPRYGAAVVTGLTVRPSSLAIRARLHRLGVRPIDNLVDATNLVLLEHGHPIHGFDLHALRGPEIRVRRAAPGETITTLDDVPRTLTDDDLLICDARGPVAVAGVMGGAESEMGPETRDVLLECAWFEPRGVRRTSRRLGLHTEASHRFERGVDRDGVPRVLRAAARLLARVGGGRVAPVALDVRAIPTPAVTIPFRPRRACRVLGIPVDAADARRILEGLGARVTEANGTDGHPALEVVAPAHRPDLTREIDLIEEVGRVPGYDEIPAILPAIGAEPAPGSATGVDLAFDLRAAAVHRGLDEAVNYAFVAPGDLEAAGAIDGAVALQNPMSEERSVMRTTLFPGLAANLRRARRHQEPRVRLFEIGRVFRDAGRPGSLPVESLRLGFVLAGPRDAWIGDGDPVDFYDGKGVADGLVEAVLGRAASWSLFDDPATEAPALHPRRAGRLSVGDRALGGVGEIHPDVIDALSLDGPAIYGELDLDAVRGLWVDRGPPQARPVPRFPSVTRDLALVLPRSHAAGEVARALAQASGGLAEDVRLFDRYAGPGVPDDHHSLAFRVRYRSADETLTDAQVDRVHGELTATAKARFGATVRGG